MTPAQKIEFIETATAHGYANAVRLLRQKHGPAVFEGSARLPIGDRNTRSSPDQRAAASSLRPLFERTARTR